MPRQQIEKLQEQIQVYILLDNVDSKVLSYKDLVEENLVDS